MTHHLRSPRSKCTRENLVWFLAPENEVPLKELESCKQQKKRKIWEGDHHLHIQCSVPTVLAAFIRKRHLNSNSIAHKSLSYLQNGLDRTSIQTILPETYKWIAEMQWEGLYKGRNSSKKGDAHSAQRKRKEEKTEAYCRRISIDF